MAVSFTASGQEYTSTSGVPIDRLFTVTCWAYINANSTTTAQILWYMDNATGAEAAGLAVNNGTPGPLAFDWVAGGNSFTMGGSFLPTTWYRTAVVVNSAAATLYMATADAADLTTYTESANYSAQDVTTFRVGGAIPVNAAFWMNGRVAALKMWNAALTKSEVARELGMYMPHRTANLNRWHPFVTNEAVDYSGNGRTLSGGSGTGTAGGPPIPWSSSRGLFIPWDPTTVRWWAHYDTTSGELLNLGSVYPDPMPSGTAVLELLSQPNLATHEWSTSARAFVLREGLLYVDRVEDLVSDSSLSSVWSALNDTQDQALKDRLAQMLGPFRYRLSFQDIDLTGYGGSGG